MADDVADYCGFLPQDQGFLAVSTYVETCGATFTLTSGRIEYVRVRLAVGGTATGIAVPVGAAVATPTAGQNLVALMQPDGYRVAISGDQGTAWGTSGWQSAAFTQPVVVPSGDYIIGILSVATTPVSIVRPGTNLVTVNGRLAGGPVPALRRYRTNATNRTTIPPFEDVVANCSETGTHLCLALY